MILAEKLDYCINDTRANGTERQILYSDHGLERVRQRLPKTHPFQRLDDQTLADKIEAMVIDLMNATMVTRVDDPQGEGYQWEVNLSPRLYYPLIIVLKDHGSKGQHLGDRRIIVTALPGNRSTNKRTGIQIRR